MNQRRTLVLIVALGVLPRLAAAQPGGAVTPFKLWRGVVADPARGEVYLMAPAGGVEALRVADGQVAWTSRDAAEPLAVAGGRLLCTAEPAAGGRRLEVVALDPASGGAAAVRGSFELPRGVRAAVEDSFDGAFAPEASSGPGAGLVVSWQATSRITRGMPTEDDAQGGPVRGPARGGATFDLATGRMVPLAPGALGPPRPPQTPDIEQDERLADVPGTQFRSADGAHVMTRTRNENRRSPDRWKWSIFAQRDGTLVGGAALPASYSPFFVSGTRLVVVTTARQRRSAEGRLVSEPLTLRAIDLSTGREVWQRPVRDTAYSGPVPP